MKGYSDELHTNTNHLCVARDDGGRTGADRHHESHRDSTEDSAGGTT